jgi:hypothetical protein
MLRWVGSPGTSSLVSSAWRLSLASSRHRETSAQLMALMRHSQLGYPRGFPGSCPQRSGRWSPGARSSLSTCTSSLTNRAAAWSSPCTATHLRLPWAAPVRTERSRNARTLLVPGGGASRGRGRVRRGVCGPRRCHHRYGCHKERECLRLSRGSFGQHS